MKRSGKFNDKLFFRVQRLSWLVLLLLLLLESTGVGLAASPVDQSSSGTIFVTTTQDTKQNDGFCSLREAVIAANSDKASGSKRGECPAGHATDIIYLPSHRKSR